MCVGVSIWTLVEVSRQIAQTNAFISLSTHIDSTIGVKILFHSIAYIKPVKNPYIVTEEQSHVDVCFELAGGANALPLTLNLYVTTSDTTAVGMFI